jgi:hypothetical protein
MYQDTLLGNNMDIYYHRLCLLGLNLIRLRFGI